MRRLEALRALRAAQLIAKGAKVATAACAVGYDDNRAFRTVFRRWTGHLPGDLPPGRLGPSDR